MGSNDTKSTSAPVTAADRLNTYTAAQGALGGAQGDSYVAPQYQAPTTERLSANYDQLQKDLSAGYTAPLDAAKATEMQAVNSDAAKRGIWSSGLALKGEQDVSKNYAPQYAAAGANATNARYQLQAGDVAGSNANNIAIANAANANQMANAAQKYESSWRPADYKAGLWNGTGGVTSSSVSGGWSI